MCIFEAAWKKTWEKTPVSTVGYPNYGPGLVGSGKGMRTPDRWVCLLDDEDPTGGDDYFPIPDKSGVVSRDGPKPPVNCEPNPVLSLTSVSNSNLGDMGPDSGEQNMRFTKVGKVNGVDVDLTLTVTNDNYSAFDAGNNGLTGSLGTVNLLSNTKAEVDFALVESETNNVVEVDGFSITWLDVDEGKRGRQRSTVTACNVETSLDASTELTSATAGSCTSVSSSKKGTKKDNPSSADNLTDVQKAKTVTMKYGAGSIFRSSLSIGGPAAGRSGRKSGRNFNFVIGATIDCP